MSQHASRVAGSEVRRRAVLLVGVGLLSGCSRATKATTTTGPAARPATSSGSTGSETSSPPGKPTLDPGSSLVATAVNSRVTVWSEPGRGSRQRLANPTPSGGPLTFLVTEGAPGWLKVLLPQRPNGSTGWIAQGQVGLTSTPYRLVISMSAHRLDVFYEGRRQASHPVGVGKAATPTPTGTYYLTELIQPPDPDGAYGPYAFGLSAFSNTLKTFAGGPGQLGLHGTDAPHGLGHDVSHGCLRVSNRVIRQLAKQVPLGTPVEIRAAAR